MPGGPSSSSGPSRPSGSGILPSRTPTPSGGTSADALQAAAAGNTPSDKDKKDDKDKKEENKGGGLTSRMSGFFSRGEKKEEKKDDKPADKSPSPAFFNRGAEKKDDKPADKDKASGGGITSRLGLDRFVKSGEKKDDKPAAQTASLGSMLRRQEEKDDKPADKDKASGGGIASRFALTRLFNRGEKKDEQKDDKPAASAGKAPSALGQAKASGIASANQTASRTEQGGLFGRLFGNRRPAPAARQRAPRTPTVASEGMSLDTKLDILGVGLIFGAIVLFFSSISAEQAAISGLHQFLGQLLGWGAILVPIAMFASGAFLIARHFGDNAPTIDPWVLGGVVLFCFCLLTTFQFVESFNYPPHINFDMLAEFVNISVQLRSGGGLIGGQAYLFLVQNFTEIGGFFILLFGYISSLFLMTDLSVAGVILFVVGVWRSFRTSTHQRAEARRARAMLAAQQANAISVSRPTPAELGSGAAAALPAPSDEGPIPIEERDILIRRGGQAISSGGEAPVPAPNPNLQSAPAPSGGLLGRFRPAPPKPATNPEPAPNRASAAAALAGGLLGGLFSRGAKEEERAIVAEKTSEAAAKSGNNLLSNVFNRAPKPAETPSATASSAPPPSPAPSATPPPSSSVSPSPTAPPATGADSGARRLGDLIGARVKPPSPSSASPFATKAGDTATASSAAPPASPFSRPPATPSPATPAPKPAAFSSDAPDDEDEALSTPSAPSSSSLLSRVTTKSDNLRSSLLDDDEDFDDDDEVLLAEGDEDADEADEGDKPDAPTGSAARLDRLNALRQGQRMPLASPTSGPRPAPATPFSRPATAPFADRADDKSATAPTPAQPAARAPSTPTDPTARPEDAFGAPKPAQPTANVPASGAGLPPKAPSSPSAFVRPAPAEPIKEETPPPTPPTPPTPAVQPSPAFGGFRPASEPVINPSAPISTPPTNQTNKRRAWRLPDYRTLLASGSEQEFDRTVLLEKARIIEDTLGSFGAPGRVVEVNTGPVITQFGVEPDYLTTRSGKKARVKVGAIAALDKDLQLALGAKSIRIEAPVPGKGYVGIEVPNDKPSLVSLRDVMESERFRRIASKSPLAIALGQAVDGSPIAADLGSMPHLLIAGTTGSGKSVCVNAIIGSLLALNPPDRVKFIMVDPKRVELTGYNGIPHLVAPVVVELERIVGVLKWVTREMDERYKQFSNAGARNIEDFNNHLNPDDMPMPYIVVIIDELADLMMLAPEETERVITRIAALARATGIHLVIATQRPSVDVVTGLIKANFPARIAFAVAGGVDSRVILDQPGAERLLGRGDMLYLSGDSPAPLRLQGVFLSDMEINNIVRYWKKQAMENPDPLSGATITEDSAPLSASLTVPVQPAQSVLPRGERVRQQAFWDNLSDETTPLPTRDGGDDDSLPDGQEDDLYEEAVALVRRLNKASVSLLQRRLRIGYTRAARLIDVMEERGVVGPAIEGSSKPREVLPS